MVRHELDARLINEIANSPAVNPFFDYRDDKSTPLDLARTVGDPADTGIMWLSNGEDAVAAFCLSDVREWQVHVCFDATCRGKRAIQQAREMLDWMRPHADTVWGAISMANPKARWFARQVGFRPIASDCFDKEGPVEIVRLGDAPLRLGLILQQGGMH